ncbi:MULTISPECIES: hypothetical protein [unclassified Streptomyces]|uniref:hypothetical protein n=1 Tax=unclassified Streptomyces TaxID=2593676 RepID=UPI0036682688
MALTLFTCGGIIRYGNNVTLANGMGENLKERGVVVRRRRYRYLYWDERAIDAILNDTGRKGGEISVTSPSLPFLPQLGYTYGARGDDSRANLVKILERRIGSRIEKWPISTYAPFVQGQSRYNVIRLLPDTDSEVRRYEIKGSWCTDDALGIFRILYRNVEGVAKFRIRVGRTSLIATGACFTDQIRALGHEYLPEDIQAMHAIPDYVPDPVSGFYCDPLELGWEWLMEVTEWDHESLRTVGKILWLRKHL